LSTVIEEVGGDRRWCGRATRVAVAAGVRRVVVGARGGGISEGTLEQEERLEGAEALQNRHRATYGGGCTRRNKRSHVTLIT
jgi:hypothetical protein